MICDKKDPTWFNSKTKSLIQEKDNAYQLYRNDKTNHCFGNILSFFRDGRCQSKETNQELQTD